MTKTNTSNSLPTANDSSETKPGYKMTKLGWLPVEWEVVRLGDLYRITSGGTPSREKQDYWLNGNIPWVTTTQIDNNVIFDSLERITDEAVENSSAKLFPKGTMLMAMYGQGITRGKVAILGIDATTNQACAAFTKPKQSVSTKYLFQYLGLKYSWIRSLSNDGGQQNLSGGLIKLIKIPLPPKPEQTRIANCLSTWDRAITTTRQLLDELRQRKKGLMQRLLTGAVRLPGFVGEWEEYKLEQCVTKSKGKIVATNNLQLGLPYVGASNFSGEYGYYSVDNEKGVRCNSDDILMLWDGENAGAVSTGHNGYASSTVAVLQPKKNTFGKFLYYKLLYQNPKIRATRTGSGIPHVDKSLLKFLNVHLPLIQEQQAIAKVLTTADQEITLYEQKLATLEEQKRGLMQQLLTGQKRLM